MPILLAYNHRNLVIASQSLVLFSGGGRALSQWQAETVASFILCQLTTARTCLMKVHRTGLWC